MKRYPFVNEYRDNRGQARRYFRCRDNFIPPHNESGLREFAAAYAAAKGNKRATAIIDAMVTDARKQIGNCIQRAFVRWRDHI